MTCELQSNDYLRGHECEWVDTRRATEMHGSWTGKCGVCWFRAVSRPGLAHRAERGGSDDVDDVGVELFEVEL